MGLMKIKKIGVLSVAKIYGAIGAVIGFVIGLFVALFSVFMAMLPMKGSIMFAGLGVLAIILVPIFYGIILFIAGACGAWIYNVFAKWVGPVEIELE
jgi:hypothetical protein